MQNFTVNYQNLSDTNVYCISVFVIRLLGCLGWLLRRCYAVAKIPGVVNKVLLLYPGRLLRCCYAVARVLWVVARVPGVVARVMLCGCYGTWAGC